jgi:hypothetical protein
MKKGYIFVLDAIIEIRIALIITETVIQNQSMNDEFGINKIQLQNIGEDLLKALNKKGDLDNPDSAYLEDILDDNLPSNVGYNLIVSIYEYNNGEFEEDEEISIESASLGNEVVSSQRLLVINNGDKFGLATIKLWFK